MAVYPSGQVRRALGSSRRLALAIEALEPRQLLSVNISTFHNDIASTGVNPSEVILTPENVKIGTFGKRFVTALDGQVYAQPLLQTGVGIVDGVNTTAGAAGAHDAVFAATENDSLYAIDTADGAILWKRSFLNIFNSGGDIDNTLGATAISTLVPNDVGAGDISPSIGITGTPVIDPSRGLLFLIAKTRETIGGKDWFVQRLHCIKLADGTDAASPFLIGQTTDGNTNLTPIYSYGNGDGSVTVPYNATGRPVVQFNAQREHQRAALNLVNDTLYVDWASHADNGPYHGWVAAWSVANLLTSGFQLKGVLNTSPNDGESGIWQSGGRLAFEPDGSAFYFVTGNGTGGAPVLGANGMPADGNYNEAVVKAILDPTSTPTAQNMNGWGMKVTDYFIPHDVVALDGADSDFGSGAPVLLPDSAGIVGHPHLMIVGGKDGRLFVLDRDNLGHFDAVNDHALNSVPDGSGHNTPPNVAPGILSTPAWFNNKLYLIGGYNGAAYTFTLGADGHLTETSQAAVTSLGYLPGSPAISANGTTNGIAWIMDRNANQIHAYDANTLATELWNSGQAPSRLDAVGAVIKFAVPTVANGQVFVGTANSLVSYGLTPAATAAPQIPVLSATSLSGSSINLAWADSSQSPNTASAYLIEQSTDNVNFTQITTAPAGAIALAIGGLTNNTTYSFRIRSFNGAGYSDYSNIASATTAAHVIAIDFSSGFANGPGQIAINGYTAFVNSRLRLTDDGGNEASSAYYVIPVDVSRFTTQFTFQANSGPDIADGLTFILQRAGTDALGWAGGAMGYGAVFTGGTGGIPNSIAIKFDLYNNEGEGSNSTGLYTNGAAPMAAGSIDLSPTGINLHSGNPFLVTMTYDGTTLSVTLTDTVTSATATQTYTIDIPATIGGATAYAGFTAGTGGQSAKQEILSWTYTASAPTAPNAPFGLGATPASATSVYLNWSTNGANQTGFHLDRATDPDFTQNFFTQTLPTSPNNFIDTATGLAPGATFYYRLRGFSGAGDSGNSNIAAVTIPLAPPKPTNQQVLSISTTTIDISWQDNAGHLADGYRILRAVNHGAFVLVASLPPTSRTPPSTYLWSDANLTPGAYYEYHIQAFNVAGNNDFAGVNANTLTTAPTSVTPTIAFPAIKLTWTAPTGAVTYNIYRGTTAGGESAIPLATGLTTPTYLDASAVPGTTYYYKVTAVNGNTIYTPPLASESAASNETSATLPVAPPAPTIPQALSVTTTSINLSWQDNAGVKADGYRILRSANNGAFTLIASLPPSSRTPPSAYLWNDSNLTPGVFYRYQIQAYNIAGNSTVAAVSAYTLTAAPSNLTASATTSAITLSWTAPTGAVTYNVYRGTTAGGESATPLASGLTTTTYQDNSAAAGVTYYYKVTAINANASPLPGESARSNEVSAALTSASTLPGGWTDADIAAPALKGSAAFNGTTWTVIGAGSDIWNQSDQFNFASRAVSGNQTLIARVTSLTNTNGWAKAGVMIRASSAANAAEVSIVATPGNGVSFQYRNTAGGYTSFAGISGLVAPVWVRMIRSGNTFTGAYSTDGAIWRAVGNPVTITMPAAVLAGLAVTSHNVANRATATFTNFSMQAATPTVLPRTGWTASASSTAAGLSPANALDGNSTTRWNTGLPQAPGQWFQLDMGAVQTIRQLILDITASPGDYPRGYAVYVSNNLLDWSAPPIVTGVGSSAVTTTSLNVPVTGRYIRIIQTSSTPAATWSIHEINAYT